MIFLERKLYILDNFKLVFKNPKNKRKLPFHSSKSNQTKTKPERSHIDGRTTISIRFFFNKKTLTIYIYIYMKLEIEI